MELVKRVFLRSVILSLLYSGSIAGAQTQDAKDVHDQMRFPCLEDGLKSSDVGCLLLAKKDITSFPAGPLYWHLNRFPTKTDAEAVSTHNAMVLEAEGKFWLFSFGPKSAAPKVGELVASVGPLQLTSDKMPAAKSYEVVAYLAVMPAGMHTRVHMHPGPEAWYMLSGQQCLETPDGPIRAHAGQGAMVGPAIPMMLTNNGKSTRRALFIVIHDAAQPWMIVNEEWKPGSACDH